MIYKIKNITENIKNKYYPILTLEELTTKKTFDMTMPEILLKKLLRENNLTENVEELKEQTLIIALHTKEGK